MAVLRGLQEIERNLQDIAATVEREIEQDVLVKAAEPAILEARRLGQQKWRQMTGEMADVRAEKRQSRSGKATVVIGPPRKVSWRAKFFEFGTSKMKARPYLRPAIRTARAEINSIIADLIGGAIRSRTRGKWRKRKAG